MIEARMKWTGGMRFEGQSAFGHTLVTDASRKAGGEEGGFKPTELVLFGLAGCTGMDVVKILQKQRQQITGVEVEVKGWQPDEYPKPYNRIEVKYIFRGRGLQKEKVEQAIRLSEDKYCMVSLSLKGTARITSGYTIEEE